MVENFKAGPYIFNVVPFYAGPLLEPKGEGEPVARLLNHAVDSTAADLASAIENRREGSDPISYVLPPETEEEDLNLRQAWAEQTGEHLNPGEVAQVGQAGIERRVPVSWKSLQKALNDLREMRNQWNPEPGPWLFTQRVLRPFVTPEDYEIVRKLESEAEAIDALDAEAEVGREPHSLIVRRQKFLTACRDAGIFRTAHGEIIEQWLSNWSAMKLFHLRLAANKLRSWGLLKGNDEEPPDGRVCLDYVRLELWPQSDDGTTWATNVIPLLPDTVSGDQGAILEHIGNSTTTIWWRRDGQLPALLAIARS